MRRTTILIAILALAATAVPSATAAVPGATPAGPSATAIAAATGVTDGRSLTPMAGGWVTTSGTTIADRVITGDVTFTGSNLTLRNVRVTGRLALRGDNVVVENASVGALTLSGTAGARVRGVDISGSPGQDGVHITSDTGRASDVLLEDVWIHNPQVTATSHYDGIQVRGVDGLTLRRVVAELGAWKPQYNAALFLEDANGGNSHVRVEDSTFVGGGYTMYSFATDVRVSRTTLCGGRWGALFPESLVLEIAEFSRVTDSFGTALSLASLHPDGGAPRPVLPARQIAASADLDGNGLGDLLTVDQNGRLFVYGGQGGGRIALTEAFGTGWGGMSVFAPGDWNGDRRADVVATDAKGDLWLYPGDGAGGLGGRKKIGHGWNGFRIVPAGDMNGDRRADLLAIDPVGKLWLYPGDGRGSFTRRIQVGNGWLGFELYAGGDGNRDGRMDILSIDRAGRLWFYAGRGGGYFAQRKQVGHGWSGYRFASGADLNGDGAGDLVGRDTQGRLFFYPGRGAGTFGSRVQIASGW